MEMRKKSYLVRLAYPFGGTPTQTSVCRMFWRTVIMALLGWPLLIALGIIALVVIAIVLAAIIAVNACFGYYVVFQYKKSDESTGVQKQAVQSCTRPIPWLPTVGAVRITPSLVVLPFTWLFGYRPNMYVHDRDYFVKVSNVWRIWTMEIKPIYLLIGLTLIGTLGWILPKSERAMVGVSSGMALALMAVGAGCIAIVIVCIRKWRTNDLAKLTREYIKARKEKVCPTIFIVD